ncbi:MAG: hypothetical protein U0587_22145 [Candidatus Binatia bacterium]
MSESQYLSIPEVAALIRKTPKTVRNMMSRGVIRDAVHYFRPRGATPLSNGRRGATPRLNQWAGTARDIARLTCR